MLNLSTLKYHRLGGDMIEMYKIITNKQDRDVTLKFNIIPAANRGNIGLQNKTRSCQVWSS